MKIVNSGLPADKVQRAKLETLLGERGQKDDQAVRWRDLKGFRAQVDPASVKDIATKVATDVATDVASGFDGANIDLSELQSRIDGAEAEAQAAAAASVNAVARAEAANAYTDTAVSTALGNIQIDIDAANAAAAQAGSFAAEAQTSTLTAQAGVARLFPPDLRDGALYWRPSAAGAPGSAPQFDTTPHEIMLDPVAGDFIRLPAQGDPIGIFPQGTAEYSEGRIIRMTVRLRSTGAATDRLRLNITTLTPEFGASRTLGTDIHFPTTAADTWQYVTREFILPAMIVGETTFRPGLRAVVGASANVAVDVAMVRIEDVTLAAAAAAAEAQAGIARDEAVVARGLAQDAAASAMSSLTISSQIVATGQGGVINDQFLMSESWVRYIGQGVSATPENTVHPLGREWRFVVSATQQDGVSVDTDSAIWTGQKDAKAYVIEVEYTLDAGTRAGAGVVMQWFNGSTGATATKTLASMTSYAVSGGLKTARGVFKRPDNFTGTPQFARVLIMANVSSFAPMAAKTIRFHRISARVASEEELGSGEVMANISAHLAQTYFTRAETNQAIANADLTLNASLNGMRASVLQNSTALASIDGTVARFTNIVTVNGEQRAGIEAVAFDGAGAGTGSAIRLIGDNVIAEGTLSTNALVVGIGRNLLIDPSFDDGAAHWSLVTNQGGTLSVRAAGSQWAHPAWPTLQVTQASASGSGYTEIRALPVNDATGGRALGTSVAAGKTYVLSGYISTHRCTASLYIYWMDADGGLISISGGQAPNAPGNPSSPDTWQRSTASGQAPAGACYAIAAFRKNATISGSDSHMFLWKPQFEETAFISQNPAPWSPGGTTYINGGRLFAHSITAREAAFENLASLNLTVGRADIQNGAVGTLQVGDGAITNAKIGNVIQSDNFATGENGTGWRILKNGTAEFNNVIIRRQIEVASGTLDVGSFVPLGAHGQPGGGSAPTGAAVNLTNGPGKVEMILTTPIPITAWAGAKRTYLANAGMTGTVSSPNTSECYWGWSAEVLPLTKWSGNQTLRIRLCFWSQSVSAVSNCILTWKIYEVS